MSAVLVEQGQPSHARHQAPEQGWELGRFMASSGMTKRPDGIIAHHPDLRSDDRPVYTRQTAWEKFVAFIRTIKVQDPNDYATTFIII
jgi:hypothetical protein